MQQPAPSQLPCPFPPPSPALLILPVDPRCQPCPKGAAVCPCRLHEGCATTAPAAIDPNTCPITTHISAYGGTGILYSVGMLRLLVSDPATYLPAAFRELTNEKPYGGT